MTLIYPMVFYVFYMVLLGLLNFFVRKSSAQNKELKLSYFKAYTGDAPERVIVVGRHFDHQFQVPLLFFITCLASEIYKADLSTATMLAWVFVATRIVHSFIHLTSNDVIKRAISFFAGFLVVLGMWINILFSI
jgi:hypothetical protein